MFRKSSEGWLKHFDFIILDLICLHLSFVISHMLHHGFKNPYADQLYRNMALFLIIADIAVMFFYETFKGVLKRGFYKEVAVTIKHACLVEVLGIVYLFSLQVGQGFSRVVLYTMVVIYILLGYVVRLFWKRYLRTKMQEGGNRSLFIVTTSDISGKVIANIKDHNYEMFRVAGFVITDKDMVGETISDEPVVANEETAVDYVCREWVDEVFIYLSKDYPLHQELMD